MSFGFDYKIPSNKTELMYDFYALSIPVREVMDEDLEFSWRMAIEENLKGMKAFALELVRRAVSSKLHHFVPFRDSEKEIEFLATYSDRDFFNQIKAVILPFRKRGDYLQYVDRYKALLKTQISDADLFRFLLICLDCDSTFWTGFYGIPKWKDIAVTGIRITGASGVKLKLLIDHVIDIAHNDGSIMDKWRNEADPCRPIIEEHELRRKSRYTLMKQFIPHVSYQLKAPLQHLSRHE